MRDDDRLLAQPDPEFGSGVIGVCDVCGVRQAVIVLQKERFKLCVIDFLNKKWTDTQAKPGAPLPPYRSDRVWFDSAVAPTGVAPAIVLSPTKVVRHPTVLITPDAYGLTTTLLDAAIRFARDGFEVLLPDVLKTPGFGPREHLTMSAGVRARGGVPLDAPRITRLLNLYSDALRYLRGRDMVDPEKAALFGASTGASLAAGLAARELKLGAVALAYPRPIRPAATWGLVTPPILLLRAGHDPLGRRAEEQIRAERKGFGGLLETAYFGSVRPHFLARDLKAYDMVVAEEAWRRIVGFVRGRLMPPPPKPPAPPVRTTPPPVAAAPPATPSAPPKSGPPPVASA
ncbi:MAG TPA: dienelactone hydrolase family protein [Thermoplasmata archaeon]|nr:dienelactone hydrolase family protein [Thermoplasmata archaeon]